ncbi:MAG: GSU2403 family nucleotidyltransferase fold protein [Elusimicrobia bacterium]|nr:GSU2403 family nucleotidyltransferase fold protein [Elusimicrobiota bacterium]
MEKKQYDLCVEILRRLHNNGLLENIIIVGSWCIPFYKEYFSNVDYNISLKTRDIDFLIPSPSKIKGKTDIPKLMEDLGFVVTFSATKGYIKLQHPDLIIELLVPEKGKGINKPFPLPQLGMNAQTLRFLDLLTDNTIRVKLEEFHLTLPHPINFALHKLIIAKRRQLKEKSEKDKTAAFEILKSLIKDGKSSEVTKIFISLPVKWQKRILNVLEEEKEFDILDILSK